MSLTHLASSHLETDPGSLVNQFLCAAAWNEKQLQTASIQLPKLSFFLNNYWPGTSPRQYFQPKFLSDLECIISIELTTGIFLVVKIQNEMSTKKRMDEAMMAWEDDLCMKRSLDWEKQERVRGSKRFEDVSSSKLQETQRAYLEQ